MFFDAILVLIGTLRTPEDQRIIPIKDPVAATAPTPADAASAPVSPVSAPVIKQESSTQQQQSKDANSDDSNR